MSPPSYKEHISSGKYAQLSALGESVPQGMYGHKGLLEHEQTVTTTMWVTVLPRWMRSPLAAWAFRAQKRREPED